MNVTFAAIAIAHLAAYDTPLDSNTPFIDGARKLMADRHVLLLKACDHPEVVEAYVALDQPKRPFEALARTAPKVAAGYKGPCEYVPGGKYAETDPHPITEERFWEMLEVLPPCRWVNGRYFEHFHVSERLSGNIVAWFVRAGKDYWEFNAPADTTQAQIIERFSVINDLKL